jgi:hypothetical protein
MGDDNGADFFFAVLKILRVWENVVDARRFRFFELETAVNYDNVVFIFDRSHIAADFFDAAEWNNSNTLRLKRRNHIFGLLSVIERIIALENGGDAALHVVSLDVSLYAKRAHLVCGVVFLVDFLFVRVQSYLLTFYLLLIYVEEKKCHTVSVSTNHL